MQTTKPYVFIIETLNLKDEKNEHFEGKVISKILNFSKVKHEYYYIRTKQEFVYVLGLFQKSSFRYLHISCHGNKNSIFTTLNEINFDDLADMFQDLLIKKRIFLSTCAATNKNLANKLISRSGCYSLIGPSKDINMDDAAIFWASFYQIMFKKNPKGMTKTRLETTLKCLSQAFDVNVKYYSAVKNSEFGWGENEL